MSTKETKVVEFYSIVRIGNNKVITLLMSDGTKRVVTKPILPKTF